MNRKGAARTQLELGAARTDETNDGSGRKARPARKMKVPRATTIMLDEGPVTEATGTAGPLPQPHQALVELVRLLARADALRARAKEKEARG